MKKNSNDLLWFQLKGYDRVRAIYKLKKDINKYGDKLGKKNNILKNILHKDLKSYLFMDLNITRLYPKTKPIQFSNDLIKNKHNSDEVKNNSEQKLIIDQTTKTIITNALNNQENQGNSDYSNNSPKVKIKNKYFSKIKSEKNILNDNNKIENDDSVKKMLFNKKNVNQNSKFFQQVNRNKTSNAFFSQSRTNIDKSHLNISPKKNKENPELINFIQRHENVQNQKLLVNTNNKNMSLYNKKNIPKIQILKFKKNKNSISSNKSDSSINNDAPKMRTQTRNLNVKKYKNKSETKMKKIKVIKRENSQDKSLRSLNYEHSSFQNSGQILNDTLINKGINTSMTASYNFYNKKRIPSYIRLPYINKISFPKISPNFGNILMENNSNIKENNIFLKDEKNKLLINNIKKK